MTKHPKAKKVYKRGRGPKALAATVARLTKPIFGKRGLAGGAIVNDWPLIAGDRLAAHSVPEKINYPPSARKAGTLHLRVDSGGMAMEIQHMGPVLIERINVFFGYKAVAGLKIIQAPLPRRPEYKSTEPRPLSATQEKDLDERLQSVDDPELRAVLDILGRKLLGKVKYR
ncbi:MAG TPA: DUF721 domain-containing protein [Rhodospirillales bacterium]|nr:DUF721 domain-containing protein [Rhodospirillales bacterium]